jgi:hypothetical protein
MLAYRTTLACCLAVLPIAVGCGVANTAQQESHQSEFVLNAEPGGALDVLDVRENAKDGQQVVVLGRIGGGIKPWFDGRAAFLVTDERVQGCEDGHCGAECAACARELAEASTMVKFLDANQKVVTVDARELLGLKEQQVVVVRGTANRDASGNLSIAATGVYVRR